VDLADIKQRLRSFICAELIRKPDYALGDNEPVITGGLIDSFSLVQVSVFIEEEFGVYIPDTDLTVADMDTLNLMAARIARE
jgi:acyl carrier protein